MSETSREIFQRKAEKRSQRARGGGWTRSSRASERRSSRTSRRLNGRTNHPLQLAGDILLLDSHLILYKQSLDLTFYVVGPASENELMLHSALLAFYDAVALLLRHQVEKRSILENLDLVVLALDEAIDDGCVWVSFLLSLSSLSPPSHQLTLPFPLPFLSPPLLPVFPPLPLIHTPVSSSKRTRSRSPPVSPVLDRTQAST
jgi:hypothetical protein